MWGGGGKLQSVECVVKMIHFNHGLDVCRRLEALFKMSAGRFLEMKPQLSHASDLTQRIDSTVPVCRGGERRTRYIRDIIVSVPATLST